MKKITKTPLTEEQIAKIREWAKDTPNSTGPLKELRAILEEHAEKANDIVRNQAETSKNMTFDDLKKKLGVPN